MFTRIDSIGLIVRGAQQIARAEELVDACKSLDGFKTIVTLEYVHGSALVWFQDDYFPVWADWVQTGKGINPLRNFDRRLAHYTEQPYYRLHHDQMTGVWEVLTDDYRGAHPRMKRLFAGTLALAEWYQARLVQAAYAKFHQHDND